MEEEQSPEPNGEPVTERARIAGVEAGIAAGLVPSGDALARPGPEGTEASSASAGTDEQAGRAIVAALSYDLPDWTDPPTLQVPRVFLDLEQEAAASRTGPPAPPPGGPVWRERQEDWNDTDAILAHLASAGPSVTDYEEPSSDDPFAYDFLDLDDDSSWIARDEDVDPQKAPFKGVASQAPVQEVAPARTEVPDVSALSEAEPPVVGPAVAPEAEEPPPREPGRRHRPQRALPEVAHAAPGPPGPRKRAAKEKSAPRNPVVATVTGVALAAVLLLCFRAGPPAVLALAAVAVTLATAELFNSLRVAGYKPATLLGLLGVPAVMVAAYFRGPTAIVLGFAGFMVLAMMWYLAGITRRSPLANLSVTVLAFGWTGVLGGFAGLLLDPKVFPDRHGIAFMLGAVIAAVGYDVGGYAIGSRLGRHNLAPSVSPHKTWEGLIGGCLVAVAASAAITSRIHPWRLSTAVVLGLIVAVVAPCGDLVESMVKRDLGVKDMGSLLPGHGGMMDRIDALLFVLPAAYCFVRLAHIG
ncbi:MAG: phosphatidate cytidylyltransferase [Acidimicrobiales bacterium]